MAGVGVTRVVSVAIPTRNGAHELSGTLAAVRRQVLPEGLELELVVLDSESTDGTRELAAAHGAAVHVIPAAAFRHGGARNRLMTLTRGEHVAFLTQDAEPATDRWLAELLAGFEAADGVGLVFGPYLPRPDAPPMVRREFEEWFARMAPVVRGAAAGANPGPDGFFSDANGAVARRAWEQVSFRDVPYAEDRVLAADMLAAGWAKAYRPGAAVLHSHAYSPPELFRRSFDEARALLEVYGHRSPAHPRTLAAATAARVRADVGWIAGRRRPGRPRLAAWAVRSAGHHALRMLGSALGGRADRLAPAVCRACSLERRAGFEPLALSRPGGGAP